jgi:hypothetical protein
MTNVINESSIFHHGRMRRGGHGLPEVSLGPACPTLYSLRAGHPSNGRKSGRPVAVFYPFGHPTLCANGFHASASLTMYRMKKRCHINHLLFLDFGEHFSSFAFHAIFASVSSDEVSRFDVRFFIFLEIWSSNICF